MIGVLYVLFGIAVVVGVSLWFVIWYGKRNPKETEENLKVLEDVDKALKSGEITPEDAVIIKKSMD